MDAWELSVRVCVRGAGTVASALEEDLPPVSTIIEALVQESTEELPLQVGAARGSEEGLPRRMDTPASAAVVCRLELLCDPDSAPRVSHFNP